MHYVDEGAGNPVLLLHGEPTWAFLYRKMIPTIAAAARAVAPDYFGFGRSDKPTRIEDYSYDFHYESIERFADELDLREATVVVQDWGGPIGLRLAVERPDRVARLVDPEHGDRRGPRAVGGVAALPRVRPPCRHRSRPGPAHPHLVRERAPATTSSRPTTRRSRRPESKAGVLAFPELVPTELDHPSAAKMLEVRAALESWDRPALVLFSDSDPIFSTVAAERHGVPDPREPDRRRRSPAQATSCRRRKARRSPERIVRFLAES